MEKLTRNPFRDSGITTYDQFKNYPFLIFGKLNEIKLMISQKISETKNNYVFSDRWIFIGQKGLGKTSTLFFINNMLKENNINSLYFTKLFTSLEDLYNQLKNDLCVEYKDKNLVELKYNSKINDLFSETLFILVDFPDTVDKATLRKFLIFVGDLFSHKDYNKINFIFAMNDSHLLKANAISELFGKFIQLPLYPFDYEETKKLIDSRFKLIDLSKEDYFSEEVLEVIYNYSKGIPRNIISACHLLLNSINGSKITKSSAEEILKKKYIDKVIDDRIIDDDTNKMYKKFLEVLREEFGGSCNSQEEYIDKLKEITGIGRTTILNGIKDLHKFGLINMHRGGYNRLNRIITIGV